jgi:lipoprotein signal peptidase
VTQQAGTAGGEFALTAESTESAGRAGQATPGTRADAPSPPIAEPGVDRWFAGKKIFWLPIVPLVVLDLWSKAAAFGYLVAFRGSWALGIRKPVFDTGWIDFELVTFLNKGTIWGFGQSMHGPLKVVRMIAIGVILWFVYKTPAKARFGLLALSLIMAGALGNLYDNVFFEDPAWDEDWRGAVRDFIHFHNDAAPHWDYPAFNVADSCITVGAITLFIVLWFTPPTTKVPKH